MRELHPSVSFAMLLLLLLLSAFTTHPFVVGCSLLGGILLGGLLGRLKEQVRLSIVLIFVFGRRVVYRRRN